VPIAFLFSSRGANRSIKYSSGFCVTNAIVISDCLSFFGELGKPRLFERDDASRTAPAQHSNQIAEISISRREVDLSFTAEQIPMVITKHKVTHGDVWSVQKFASI
jgi:hypothetical protein